MSDPREKRMGASVALVVIGLGSHLREHYTGNGDEAVLLIPGAAFPGHAFYR